MLYCRIGGADAGKDAADTEGRLVLKKLGKNNQTKQVGVDDEKRNQQQNTHSKYDPSL